MDIFHRHSQVQYEYPESPSVRSLLSDRRSHRNAAALTDGNFERSGGLRGREQRSTGMP